MNTKTTENDVISPKNETFFTTTNSWWLSDARAPTKGAVNPDLSTSVSYNTVGNGLCAVPQGIEIRR